MRMRHEHTFECPCLPAGAPHVYCILEYMYRISFCIGFAVGDSQSVSLPSRLSVQSASRFTERAEAVSSTVYQVDGGRRL